MNKFKRKNQIPLCACGCGERVKKSQDHESWNKFIAYHSNRGKYNPMYGRDRSGKNHPLYGKKGIDNPNTRKIGSKMSINATGRKMSTKSGKKAWTKGLENEY
jgi:hypothetical protein